MKDMTIKVKAADKVIASKDDPNSTQFDEDSLLGDDDLAQLNDFGNNAHQNDDDMDDALKNQNGIYAILNFQSADRTHCLKGKLVKYEIMSHRLSMRIVAPSNRILRLLKYWHTTCLSVSKRDNLIYKQSNATQRRNNKTSAPKKASNLKKTVKYEEETFKQSDDLFVSSYIFYRRGAKPSTALTVSGRNKSLNIRVKTLEVVDNMDEMNFNDELVVHLSLAF